jgi:hypothetical protein
VPLPMIKNAKTVDPADAASPAVFQLETAMGAAIESFKGAGAVVVDRSRFKSMLMHAHVCSRVLTYADGTGRASRPSRRAPTSSVSALMRMR